MKLVYTAIIGATVFANLLIMQNVEARPEYTLKVPVSCSSCHANPVGGGPRKVMGKAYGSDEFPTIESSSQELYHADFRAQYYSKTKHSTRESNGLIMMVAAGSVYFPVKKNVDGSALHLLATYDMAPLAPGAREQILIWSFSQKRKWFTPSNVMFGKFYVPFGLLTDEHRTYTKLQTGTSLRDYEMGTNISWDLPIDVHLDIAVTNGFQSAGGPTSDDNRYALISNIRWNPNGAPLFVGTSYSHHDTVTGHTNPWAVAGYMGLDFGNLTNNYFNASISGEYVRAKGWSNVENNAGIEFFLPSEGLDAFSDGVKNSESTGYYGLFKWKFLKHFTLIYKHDYLALDKEYRADSFVRKGAGLRWQFDSNLILSIRHESVKVGAPAIKSTDAKAAQEIAYMQFRFWM